MKAKYVAGAIVGASLMVSACATSPSKISAAYVSPMKYQNHDCQQIGIEQASIEQRTNVLYHSLKKRNTSDKWMMGVGLVVAWPALLFLKGNNGAQNSEYAQLKGDYEALRTSSVAKKCELTFASDLAATVSAKKPAAAKGTPAATPAAPAISGASTATETAPSGAQ